MSHATDLNPPISSLQCVRASHLGSIFSSLPLTFCQAVDRVSS